MSGIKRRLSLALSIVMVLSSSSLGSINVYGAEGDMLLADESSSVIQADDNEATEDSTDISVDESGAVLQEEKQQTVIDDIPDGTVISEEKAEGFIIAGDGNEASEEGSAAAKETEEEASFNVTSIPQTIRVNDDKYHENVRVGDFIYDIYDGTHFAILRQWDPVSPEAEMDVVIPSNIDLNEMHKAGEYSSGLLDDNYKREVIGINGGAFAETEEHRLRSVVIPDTVRMIDAGAFADCTLLTSIRFPELMTTTAKDIYPEGLIGDNAFSGCTSLATVTLPKKLDTVGTGIFAGCTSLTSVEIPRDWGSTVVKKNKKDYSLQEGTVVNGPFSACDNLSVITFAEGTSKIANYMLADCDSIADISIPDTLTTIGNKSFYGCDNLTTLNLGTGSALVDVGDWAFQKCVKLTAARLPKYTKTIGQGAFLDCTSIKETTIPFSISKVGAKAFFNCIELGSISFEDGDPQNITGGTIGNYAFGDAYDSRIRGYGHPLAKLEQLTIPNSFVMIGEGAFEACTGLKSLIFVNRFSSFAGSQTLSKRAFYSCTALESISFSDNIEMIGESAFEECSALKTLTFEDKADSFTKSQTIGKRAFYNCVALEDISFSEKLELIGVSAFENCGRISRVTIPNSVKKIDIAAFKACIFLSDLKLSEKLETIGEEAFSGCISITRLNIPMSIKSACPNVSNTVITDGDVVKGAFYGTNLTYVYFVRYNNDDPTRIPNKILLGATWVQSIEMPNEETTEIGNFAFAYCTALKEIKLPDSLVTICGGAFGGCTRLGESKSDGTANTLTVPGKVTSIERSAFKYCIALEQVQLPNSLESLGRGIGDGAFESCTSLKEINIPDNVTEIGAATFKDCEKLTKVKLPASTKDKSIKKIDEQLFMGCMKLAEVKNVSKDYLEEIGNSAFEGCISLTAFDGMGTDDTHTMDFSEYKKLKSIGSRAFYGCDSISAVTLSASTETLGDSVFDNCKSLAELTIGTGPRVIPENAFANDPGLVEVTIPRNVLILKKGAFSKDINLAKIHIPKNTEIEADVFSYCDKLTICGFDPSPAKKYADDNDITFEPEVKYAETIRFTDNTPILLNLNGRNNTDKADVPSLDIKPVNYSVDVEYFSSNEEVFTVEPYEYTDPRTKLKETRYRVIAKGVGTAELTAQAPKDADNNMISAMIKVTVKKPVESITPAQGISRDNTIIIPDTLQLAVVVNPADATDKTYVWKSADESICYVNQKGVVYSKGVGTTQVYAVSNDDDTKVCAFNITVVINWGDIDEEMRDKLFDNDRNRIPRKIWFTFKGDDTVYLPSNALQVTKVSKKYTGGKITFNGDISVFYGIEKLVEGRDYQIKYRNNKNAADATASKPPTIRISGKGSYYKGKEDFSFTIEQAEPADKTVKIACLNTKPEYTGSTLTLADLFKESSGFKYTEVTLYTQKDGKKTELVRDRDYTFDESQLRDTGSFNLIFELKGAYSGTVVSNLITVKPYDVKKHPDEIKVEYAGEVEHSRAGAEPAVTVHHGTRKLREGVDYKVTYSGNKKPCSDAKLKIQFAGCYKGILNGTFRIVQKDVSKLTVFASDIKYKDKKGNFKVTPKILDGNTAVSTSTDIEAFSRSCTYYYASGEKAGQQIDDKATVEPGQIIEVKAEITAKNKTGAAYKGTTTISGLYSVYAADKDIKKAVLTPKKVVLDYDEGREIVPVYGADHDFILTMPGAAAPLSEDDIEIFSVTKNRFLGTATVQVRGKNGYGGIKKFTVKIKARDI